jgi:hypothetical protein
MSFSTDCGIFVCIIEQGSTTSCQTQLSPQIWHYYCHLLTLTIAMPDHVLSSSAVHDTSWTELCPVATAMYHSNQTSMTNVTLIGAFFLTNLAVLYSQRGSVGLGILYLLFPVDSSLCLDRYQTGSSRDLCCRLMYHPVTGLKLL